MNVPSSIHARMEERVATSLEATSVYVEPNILERTARQVTKQLGVWGLLYKSDGGDPRTFKRFKKLVAGTTVIIIPVPFRVLRHEQVLS